MINSEFFINIPFGEIYPMTTEIVNKLIVSLSAKIIDVNIGNVFVDGLKDDMYIIIEKEGKAIKYPKLKTIYTTLVASSITNILIIAPAFSNKCYDFAMEKEFHIMTINSFMNEEMRITYTKNLGRKAWTHDAKKNMTISVLFQLKGIQRLDIKDHCTLKIFIKLLNQKLN